MRKYLKNKKMAILAASVLATTLILTGTFAWSVRLFSTTGGLGEEYHYLVKLLDEDSDPLFVNNNWKSGALDKKVYATSSYKVENIATKYEEIMDKDSNSIFRDTWIRIKLEETFTRNGETSTTTVTEMLGDTLKSSVSNGKYFTFDTIEDTETILLSNWNGDHGRFWILDEDTGWLYWAQPLLATTFVDGSNPELADQTTDHIIDEVELKLQPSGVWEYTIKATLEAMDVELQGYKEEGAWDDIDETHDIYPLFDDVVVVNPTNFPDETFRTWITSNVVGAENNILTSSEIKAVTNIDISNQGITDVTGLECFTDLTTLDVSKNQLGYLDVSALIKLNKTSEAFFKYNPQYRADGITTLLQDNDSENIKEWHIPQFDETGNYLLFNEHNFPDLEFRIYLETVVASEYDDFKPSYIANGKISLDDLKKVKLIRLTNRTIVNLRGIEHFPNLAELRASGMQYLTHLDISKNKELINLYANNNPSLRSLDVSYNEKLIYLQTSNTSINSLDVSNNKELSTLLSSQMPYLTSLDLRENGALATLYATDNPLLINIELGSKPYLASLRVQNNQLSELNIAGCTKLNKVAWSVSFYQTQLMADGETPKILKTILPLTAETNLLEWE